MDWIKRYSLFLFDFDGVLVNSEKLHYEAYGLMCRSRGYKLPLDFQTYCSYALYSSKGIRDAIYEALPALQQQEPNWEVLYQEKKRHYQELIRMHPVPLMPGVATLLTYLKKFKIPHCVVTNSNRQEVDLIKEKHPVLQEVSTWFTREEYNKPKPDPECYLKAIEHFDPEGEIVGFEDSPRGLKALLGTPAHAHLIGEALDDQQREALFNEFSAPFEYVPSFTALE